MEAEIELFLGEDGVLALVCDSTNAMRPGDSGSEAEVRRALDGVLGGLVRHHPQCVV